MKPECIACPLTMLIGKECIIYENRGLANVVLLNSIIFLALYLFSEERIGYTPPSLSKPPLVTDQHCLAETATHTALHLTT